MNNDPVVIHNWSPQDPEVRQSALGWRQADFQDAGSDDPQQVFNFYWKHCFSIIFYYVKDGHFYELFMEDNPFKFWRVNKKTDWDGKWISRQIAWNEHEEGEVLFTFDDDTDLWHELKLNGVPIGDVLADSLIAEINY